VDGIEQILNAAFVLAQLHGEPAGLFFDAGNMRQVANFPDHLGGCIGELNVNGPAEA
jgi:hypothetical protein